MCTFSFNLYLGAGSNFISAVFSIPLIIFLSAFKIISGTSPFLKDSNTV